MKKSNIGEIACCFVIGAVLIGIVWGGFWTINNTMFGKKIKNSWKSGTTGLERSVDVYTYSGEKLAEYDGKISVDDGNGGTVSITLENGQKITFANVSVIVEEKGAK